MEKRKAMVPFFWEVGSVEILIPVSWKTDVSSCGMSSQGMEKSEKEKSEKGKKDGREGRV